VKSLVLKAAYYLPSRDEFAALWGVTGTAEGLSKLDELAPKLVVIVKSGANGAEYRQDGRTFHVPAEKVERVVNATGAGDSFNAGVISAMLKGRPVTEAAAYGCRVAAAKISGKRLPHLP
jgi:sugar/nucleoside kinase (ribokinase family)